MNYRRWSYHRNDRLILIIIASYLLVFFERPIYFMNSITSLNQIPPSWESIRILTANVGNLSLECRGAYNNKLCLRKVETKIARNLQDLQPDIVFLQELLHPSQCNNWSEVNKKKVCFDQNAHSEPNQVRRLLGKSYTILCAARNRTSVGHPVGMECIAVHTKIGSIEGCASGELCFSLEGLDTPGQECNQEFVIMSTIAKVRNINIRLINAHPHSRDKNCRDNSLRQVFESLDYSPESKTIIAGDFNFDPFRNSADLPDIWQRNVGPFGSNKPFYYHSGTAEHNPPYPTAHFLLQKKTIDHVVSNFAKGTCITLGEAPGTLRIDGGQGMDHRAVLCDLWIPSQ